MKKLLFSSFLVASLASSFFGADETRMGGYSVR